MDPKVGNSIGMEVCGAKTLLEFLGERNCLPDTLGTDRSSSVRWGDSHCRRKHLNISAVIYTRRYGPLSGPISRASAFGRGFFCPLGKKVFSLLFWPIFGNFGFPVVTLVTFSRSLSNFEKNPDKTREKSPFYIYLFLSRNQTNYFINYFKKRQMHCS